MQSAVIYARVSSREQEREGYSIPAQRKLLAEYARLRDFCVQQEFIDVESAKNPGRKEFGAMLRLLQSRGTLLRMPIRPLRFLLPERRSVGSYIPSLPRGCI